MNVTVGSKDLGTLTHLISSPRPKPRSKKYPRTDGENPGLQIVRPKTVISSTGHNHWREKCHIIHGGPLEDCEGDSRPYGLAVGGWWRDNPRRSHHLRIKYTQLTLWPRDVDVTPGQRDGGHNYSQNAKKNCWGDVHLRIGLDDWQV